MMIKVKKLKIPWYYSNHKILATKKIKKIFQDRKKEEKEILIDLYFNKEID